jgi:hypothetical protein
VAPCMGHHTIRTLSLKWMMKCREERTSCSLVPTRWPQSNSCNESGSMTATSSILVTSVIRSPVCKMRRQHHYKDPVRRLVARHRNVQCATWRRILLHAEHKCSEMVRGIASIDLLKSSTRHLGLHRNSGLERFMK